MEQTSNYQLNQWDKTDRIQMEDFNADNAKIDAALAEVRGANQYVKIKEMTVSSAASQVNFDVSDVDFTQYWTIELFCDAANPLYSISMRVNGFTSGYYYGGASGIGSGYDSPTTSMGALGGRVLFYTPITGAEVGCCCFSGRNNSFSGMQYVAPCKWEELNTFNLSRNTVIPAGTKIALYGLKK